MPRYLVFHRIHKVFDTQDAWVEDFKELRRRATGEGGGARWFRSWYAGPESELICEWEAPSPAEIPSCFTREELQMAPIVRVLEVAFVDASWLE
jgi:hypothetical protein